MTEQGAGVDKSITGKKQVELTDTRQGEREKEGYGNRCVRDEKNME